ncbi:MAG: SIR2 family protein, partial [Chloroflexota bacterium]
MAEPPYGEIADLLKKGQIVPFLGAGVNFGARAPGATWSEATTEFLPSGAELSRYLASKANFPSQDPHDLCDLAKVSSYYSEMLGRRRLRERLSQLFCRPFEVCAIHAYLAEIAARAPLLIVTTNYDNLTEFAFNQAGRAFDRVIHPTDRKEVEASVLWWKYGATEPVAVEPNRLFVDLKTTTVIYKMHGTADCALNKWDSYVITEDDYVDFLSRMTSQTAVPAL